MSAKKRTKPVRASATSRISIELAAAERRSLDRRARRDGYPSTSAYVRELIRRDQDDSRIERVQVLIDEALRSPATVWTDADTRALEARVRRYPA